MRIVRLLGVLCAAYAGYAITRFPGRVETGLAIAAFLAGFGLVLFFSRRAKKTHQKYITAKVAA